MLWVDDRAGSRDLLSQPALSSLCELCRLDSADVCFQGNGASGPVLVGIELKSLSDLISSSSTGRLQATQLPAMLATYDISYLLYYGNYKSSSRDGTLLIERGNQWRSWRQGPRSIPYSYLESFLLTVSALGVNIKHCSNLSESAEWISILFRWWSKPWQKHKGLRTFDKSRNISLLPGSDSRTLLRAKIASQLPGLGFEKAIAAANSFASVREMIGADSARWAKVDGIGSVVSKAIEQALK